MKLSTKAGYAIVLVALLLAAGTMFFHRFEGWSYVDSFYFSTMTMTTVGYGDFVPTTDASKVFVSVYAIAGISVMLYLVVSTVGVFFTKQKRHYDHILEIMHNLRENVKNKGNNKKKK